MEINYLLSLYRNGLHNVSRFILCKVRTYVRCGRAIGRAGALDG